MANAFILLVTYLILGWCITISTGIQWPNSSFGLPSTYSGCPGDLKSGWREGWRLQDMENDDKNHDLRSKASLKNHFAVTFRLSKMDIERKFCMLDQISNNSKSWPRGAYCVYKSNNACPNGMSSGSVKWDDEDDWPRRVNDRGGQLPDGTYDRDTTINYCCRTNGNWYDSIELPVMKPFYLLTSNSLSSPKCQMVKWATSQMEYILFDTEDDNNSDNLSGNHVLLKL
ncbi:uncharacterized protein LOC124433368 [Xenia sp. Carnegie-2017]|uniref:uncharacterized protein LOC124433368 n=1 Tax=Xenia sp. Carnegie-2017 TaxID=2897299 RepID=UPI001F03B168|nr:uncharacterized protein LOC124433368 [Xenia sp. Carnegie-2017]